MIYKGKKFIGPELGCGHGHGQIVRRTAVLLNKSEKGVWTQLPNRRS